MHQCLSVALVITREKQEIAHHAGDLKLYHKASRSPYSVQEKESHKKDENLI